ncbi:linaridin-like RiPP [Streptomyces sp. QL37]|uniref:linaridin-like RiPP n=1 Tax=Streptomyces sp. QL37 TaxID=2093747 RepID=UPI000CF1DB8A|nr:linaridin-like RiPP [Streptomyces sp. QL37]PPQ56337.1 hypothetical protein C5F59_06350 [Streptomyces sp. QL37]
MSIVAQFANESLTDVTPGVLSGTATLGLNTPADPVMATPVLAFEVFLIATEMLYDNVQNYTNS